MCEELNTVVEPYVLAETPAVLSICRRCMRMGYGFHWHPGVNLVLVTPDGNVVSLSVERDIPYLVVGSENSMPRKPVSYREVPLAPAVESVPHPDEKDLTLAETNNNKAPLEREDDGQPISAPDDTSTVSR